MLKINKLYIDNVKIKYFVIVFSVSIQTSRNPCVYGCCAMFGCVR